MKSTITGFLLLTGLCLAACNGGKGQTRHDTTQMKSFGNNANANRLLGAGSSVAYPLFSKLFAEYTRETHVMVNYRSVGSAGGILQLTNKAVDFGEADAPLNEAQIKQINPPALQITLFRHTAQGRSGDSSHGGTIRALIYKEQNYEGRSLMRAQKLLKFFWWAIHDGQNYCNDSGYIPLAPAEVSAGEMLLKSATFNGKPILQ